jgi:alpha-L-rhamnosidase
MTTLSLEFPPVFARCNSGNTLSLCHAWSCGVTAWLTENVIGIRPQEAGCRVIAIRPQLGDLSWVEGTLPTPHGTIRIRHEKNSFGEIETQAQVPDGIDVQ